MDVSKSKLCELNALASYFQCSYVNISNVYTVDLIKQNY